MSDNPPSLENLIERIEAIRDKAEELRSDSVLIPRGVANRIVDAWRNFYPISADDIRVLQNAIKERIS